LEKKRQQLESEMDRLQNEIEKEKLLYRQAIDDEIERRQQMICSCHIPKQSNTVLQQNSASVMSIDPLDFRGGFVDNFLFISFVSIYFLISKHNCLKQRMLRIE